MSSNKKSHALHGLSQGLKLHRPELKGRFVCPICLWECDIKDRKHLSIAHIIPQAVGGQVTTFACKKCNNDAGTLQDKWLGEFAKMLKSPAGIFATSSDRFMFGEVPVRGKVSLDEGGAPGRITFAFEYKHNPPGLRNQIEAQLDKLRNQYDGVNKVPLGLGMHSPMLENIELVDIGFLTAGYLAWFKFFGYSWVFQSHLDPVRKAIMSPRGHKLDRFFFGTIPQANWIRPWIGVVSASNEIAPAFGFLNRIVFYPPKDRPNLYDYLKAESEERSISMIVPSDIWAFNGVPAAMQFKGRTLIYPDAIPIQRTYTLHPNYEPMPLSP